MRAAPALLATALLLASCDTDNPSASTSGDSDSPSGSGRETALHQVSGDGQEGPAGFYLSEPLVVLVTVDGVGAPGRAVQFAVVDGDARCQQTTVTTDSAGLASTHVLLGSATGPVRVGVSLPAATDTTWFAFTAVAASPAPVEPDPDSGTPPGGLGDYALRFRGASRHEVRVGLVASGGDQYTVELWLRPSAAAGPHSLSLPVQVVGQQATDGDAKGSISCTNGTVGFMFSTVDQMPHALYVSQAAPYDEWTHVAGVYDGSAMFVYVNGTLQAEAAVTGAITRADIRGRGTILGGLAGTVDVLDQWFTGDLDEVRIWEVARTATEIRTHMHRPVAAQPGLIGYWPFDEGTGASTADHSGFGYHGQLSNFHGNGQPAWIPGVFTEIDTTGS